jgi:hypothetical protein
MKLYIPVEGKENVSHIKVDTFYDLGGTNYWTYKQNKRGYYVSCTPVFREDRGGVIMESTILGTGYKKLCKEVTRHSKKAAAEAEATAEKLYEAIVRRICREEGLTIMEVAV